MVVLCSTRVGLAMLILQGVGLLLFLITAIILLASFLKSEQVMRFFFGARPADKFALAVQQVMAKVRLAVACVSHVWLSASSGAELAAAVAIASSFLACLPPIAVSECSCIPAWPDVCCCCVS